MTSNRIARVISALSMHHAGDQRTGGFTKQGIQNNAMDAGKALKTQDDRSF